MSIFMERKGIRIERREHATQVINNRRCRVAVKVNAGEDHTVINAAGPSNWHPSTVIECPQDAVIVAHLEKEGERGPDPSRTGPFDFGTESITFLP